jgi:hypothetical protein
MPDLTTIPDPALSRALAEVLRLEGKYRDAVLRGDQLETQLQTGQHVIDALAEGNRQLRADLARAQRFAADQQRAAENCGHNLEAAEQDVETLREALEWYADEVCYHQTIGSRIKRPEVLDDRGARARAALAATAPEGEGPVMLWTPSHRADTPARLIADRHYSRQKPGTSQFVKPGRCFVLRHPWAVWATSWPFAEYVKHAWAGAWECSIFRYERLGTDPHASEMIRAAVAHTRYMWPEVPELGMVTFIDPTKVRPIKRRGAETWGYSYARAGFTQLGQRTKAGLLVMQMLPGAMPEPCAPWLWKSEVNS